MTINEKIDPVLVEDASMPSSRSSATTGAGATTTGRAERPSHGRASVAGSQVLIPLRDGALALGTYQAIFLCEFDGPKARSVYVSVLQ